MQRDWDDAYAQMAHIPNGAEIAAAWPERALRFREASKAELDVPYGDHLRQAFDLFRPAADPNGLTIFIHGGYWMLFGRGDFSHLARGAVERGQAVAVPSYRLAPDVSLTAIKEDIARMIQRAAALVPGPISLMGHSAGGHLALRMICDDSPLPNAVLARISRVTGIGGVYDLRPLMMTELNWTLHLDGQEAASESPILHRPKLSAPVTIWAGAGERPEFVRQSRAMALMWDGLGADVQLVEEPDRHHFNVLDGLEDPHSPLMNAVLGG